VAWLGAVAIVGLVICAFGELRDARWRRKERKLPPGAVLPPRWSGRRVALVTLGAVLMLALIAFLVNLALPTPKQVKISTKNATTTTTIVASTTTSTPVATLPAGGRPPSQVHVAVLNGTGVSKAAGTKALALGTLGYAIVNTGNAPVQATTVVECKPTFTVEAATLAAAVGAGTTVAPYPVTPPSGSAAADCVVILGK
jgi:hypothetical protein